jgi:hypothetical protein
MPITPEQWEVFREQLRKGDTREDARRIADISEDDYFDAHKGKDPILERILLMDRFYTAEKAIEVVHDLATGASGKKRSGPAIKVLEAYMPELFRQKMAHKIQIDARHTVTPAFHNPNFMLSSGNDPETVDAEVVAIEDGKLPRKKGGTLLDGIKELAKKNGVEDVAGIPELWTEQGGEDDDPAIIELEEAQ